MNRALCKLCAHACFRCQNRASFVHADGKRICSACSLRFRKIEPLTFSSGSGSAHFCPCSMSGCSRHASQYLTPFQISDGLNSFPKQSASRGYFVSRRLLLHCCGLTKEGTFLCPATSGRTSCTLIHCPALPCNRAHTGFHHPHWILLQDALSNFWSKRYCKAHAFWLDRFGHVIEHLLRRKSLPLIHGHWTVINLVK